MYMGKVRIASELCKGCTLCVDVCPKHLLQTGKNINSKGYCFVELKDMRNCTACKLCAVMCPDAAIEVFK